jgi:hypothetical protein
VPLNSLIVPVSAGKVTWQTSPSCRITGGQLVTPNRGAACYLTASVSRSGTTPAMSTRVKLAIQ